MFNLSSNPTSPTPILSLLNSDWLDNPLPLLLLSLSLPPSMPLIVLTSLDHLNAALQSTHHPRPSVIVMYKWQVYDLLEHIWNQFGDKVGLLVVRSHSDEAGGKVDIMIKEKVAKGMKIKYWDDIWEMEDKVKEKADLPGEFLFLSQKPSNSQWHTSTTSTVISTLQPGLAVLPQWSKSRIWYVSPLWFRPGRR
jgi:hypothetical protein